MSPGHLKNNVHLKKIKQNKKGICLTSVDRSLTLNDHSV